MSELVFTKGEDEYFITIKTKSRVDDFIHVTLDSGSPISIICVQHLIELTNEPRVVLLNKLAHAIETKNFITFYVYGAQDSQGETKRGRQFVPYLLSDVNIGNQILKYFLIWVDVTNYSTSTAITDTLFGYDYIKQGQKWFDKDDNFHIKFETNPNIDLRDVKGALSSVVDRITPLNEIKRLSISKENVLTAKFILMNKWVASNGQVYLKMQNVRTEEQIEITLDRYVQENRLGHMKLLNYCIVRKGSKFFLRKNTHKKN